MRKELTNIFRRIQYRLSRQYPVRILPSVKYKLRLQLTEIAETPVYLVRRSDKSPEKTFNKLGHVREDAFVKKDIPRMSMFLMGGKLLLDHICFRTGKQGSEEWGGEKVYFQQICKDFLKLEVATPIFFNLTDLNEISFPYRRKDDKDTKRLVESLKLQSVKDASGDIRLEGRSGVQHSPTVLNYWHTELMLNDVAGKPIKQVVKDGHWTASAAEYMYQHLLSVGQRDSPRFNTISPKFYLKGRRNFKQAA